MTRIVIVAPEDLPIPPTRGGSVQIYVHQLTRALANQNNLDIHLLCPGKAKAKRTDSSIRCTCINKPKSAYQRTVAQILKKLKPDIVQIENRPALLLMLKKAYPQAQYVLNLHSTTFLGPSHIQPKNAGAALKQADLVVLNSQFLQKKIARRLGLTKNTWRSKVIYPGVDPAFLQSERKQRPYVPGQSTRLLFVGRIIRQKGVLVLIRAVRRLIQQGIPVELTIVGRTPPWERLYGERVRSEAKGLPIRFVGFIAPSLLPQIYANADIFICPSQGTEAFGLVNVEALAVGLPVVASNLGGIREVLQSDCGILVDLYEKPSAFAHALTTLITKPEVYQRLEANAKKRALVFTWNQTARHFKTAYSDLLK